VLSICHNSYSFGHNKHFQSNKAFFQIISVFIQGAQIQKKISLFPPVMPNNSAKPLDLFEKKTSWIQEFSCWLPKFSLFLIWFPITPMETPIWVIWGKIWKEYNAKPRLGRNRFKTPSCDWLRYLLRYVKAANQGTEISLNRRRYSKSFCAHLSRFKKRLEWLCHDLRKD